MSTKFTPAPWAVADVTADDPHHEGYRWDVHVPGKQTLCMIKREEDAHLIAVAPALYEALNKLCVAQDAVQQISGGTFEHAEMAIAAQIARLVLTKARGEA